MLPLDWGFDVVALAGEKIQNAAGAEIDGQRSMRSVIGKNRRVKDPSRMVERAMINIQIRV